MSKHDTELIAALLGDATPSAQLRKWLCTPAGQRELAAYRETLRTLNSAYGLGTAQPLLMLSYAIVDSPIGRLVLAATPMGLARVSFRRPVAAVVNELRSRWHVEVRESTDQMRETTAQFDAYFAGKRRSFDLPIDLSLATPFQRRVLLATRSIAAGEVVPYAEIARRIGQPHASRAVGQALGSNPIPIVIPCHRIVGSGGRLGGYTGGLAIKRKLLALEGAGAVTRDS